MTRSRVSARQAGSKFERATADYLASEVDDRIDRRVKTGNKDRGDVGGLRAHGSRVTVECKDTSKIEVGTFLAEVEVERGNDDGLAGVVVAKRRGKRDPADALVLMTLRDLVALITGVRP